MTPGSFPPFVVSVVSGPTTYGPPSLHHRSEVTSRDLCLVLATTSGSPAPGRVRLDDSPASLTSLRDDRLTPRGPPPFPV